MTEKEFSRLSRRELLKLLLMQVQEQNQLEEKMAEMTKQVQEWEESRGRLEQNLNAKNGQIAELERYLGEKNDQIKELKGCLCEKENRVRELEDTLAYERELKDIRLSESDGTIAEATLKLNEIFEAAQKTADQYVENIALLSGKHDIGGEDIRNKAAGKEKSERKELKKSGSDLSAMIRNEGKKGFEALRRGMSDIRRNVKKDVRKKER